MADIFISYSRKDAAHAFALAERLRREGMSVWIDQERIEFASSWSKQIVYAVEHCSAFILLLSKNSMQSENVSRELSLAFESHRKLLPIELEPVVIPDDFKYHIAGIQRTSIENLEAILMSLHTIAPLGDGAEDASPVEGMSSPSHDSAGFNRKNGVRTGSTSAAKSKSRLMFVGLIVLIVGGVVTWWLTRSTASRVVSTAATGDPSIDPGFRRYASKNPEVNRLFSRARELAPFEDSAHHVEYMQVLQAAIDLDSTFAIAIANLAAANMDSLPKARRLAVRAMMVGPNVPTGYAVMGQIQLKEGDEDGAYRMASKGLELSDSSSGMSWSVLGDICRKHNDYVGLTRAIHGQCRDTNEAHNYLPGSYFELLSHGQDTLAHSFSVGWREWAIRYVRANPRDRSVLFLLVLMLDDCADPRLGPYQQKLEEFAISSDPDKFEKIRAAAALTYVAVRHHRDEDVKKYFEFIAKLGGPKYAYSFMKFPIMKRYASQPPFSKHLKEVTKK